MEKENTSLRNWKMEQRAILNPEILARISSREDESKTWGIENNKTRKIVQIQRPNSPWTSWMQLGHWQARADARTTPHLCARECESVGAEFCLQCWCSVQAGNFQEQNYRWKDDKKREKTIGENRYKTSQKHGKPGNSGSKNMKCFKVPQKVKKEKKQKTCKSGNPPVPSRLVASGSSIAVSSAALW